LKKEPRSRRWEHAQRACLTNTSAARLRYVSAPARVRDVGDPDGSDKAIIKEHMDKAGKLMDDMLNDILNELFAEQVRSTMPILGFQCMIVHPDLLYIQEQNRCRSCIRKP
jgi:hypothetical protein